MRKHWIVGDGYGSKPDGLFYSLDDARSAAREQATGGPGFKVFIYEAIEYVMAPIGEIETGRFDQ